MAQKRVSTKKSSKKTRPTAATPTTRKAKATPMLINRFAHPFFTPKPVAERKAVPGVGKRMTDHIEGTLLAIPNPIRNPPTMSLDEIIGQQSSASIAATGSIMFHAVGDTGHAG